MSAKRINLFANNAKKDEDVQHTLPVPDAPLPKIDIAKAREFLAENDLFSNWQGGTVPGSPGIWTGATGAFGAGGPSEGAVDTALTALSLFPPTAGPARGAAMLGKTGRIALNLFKRNIGEALMSTSLLHKGIKGQKFVKNVIDPYRKMKKIERLTDAGSKRRDDISSNVFDKMFEPGIRL